MIADWCLHSSFYVSVDLSDGFGIVLICVLDMLIIISHQKSNQQKV